ncbi:hypothetical protein BCF33_2541 [Hasllibacter halocynthiae]|uniref:2TM domain-containing protein n=1 Tax=Hasllibacter halocynthiae TaxID=595589 RepID=A0A2T0X3Z9_9RHOB|nr:hypothetical protein [Hasllibacter halocynthiae]PRY93660.1 hypothetical protein BCF33_2541 [Hasllibacter halocynthiae]
MGRNARRFGALAQLRTRGRVAFAFLLVGVVAAHVALWLSDMPDDAKWRLTVLNAAGWTVVLGPVWLVGRWLAAVEKRNAERERGEP